MNKKNMRTVADRIEKYPDKYDQDNWCGTAYCLAGHAAVLDGWKLGYHSGDTFFDPGSDYVTKDDHEEWIHDVAKDFLGLNDRKAHKLFDGIWKPLDGYTVPEQLRRYADGLDEIT